MSCAKRVSLLLKEINSCPIQAHESAGEVSAKFVQTAFTICDTFLSWMDTEDFGRASLTDKEVLVSSLFDLTLGAEKALNAGNANSRCDEDFARLLNIVRTLPTILADFARRTSKLPDAHEAQDMLLHLCIKNQSVAGLGRRISDSQTMHHILDLVAWLNKARKKFKNGHHYGECLNMWLCSFCGANYDIHEAMAISGGFLKAKTTNDFIEGCSSIISKSLFASDEDDMLITVPCRRAVLRLPDNSEYLLKGFSHHVGIGLFSMSCPGTDNQEIRWLDIPHWVLRDDAVGSRRMLNLTLLPTRAIVDLVDSLGLKCPTIDEIRIEIELECDADEFVRVINDRRARFVRRERTSVVCAPLDASVPSASNTKATPHVKDEDTAKDPLDNEFSQDVLPIREARKSRPGMNTSLVHSKKAPIRNQDIHAANASEVKRDLAARLAEPDAAASGVSTKRKTVTTYVNHQTAKRMKEEPADSHDNSKGRTLQDVIASKPITTRLDRAAPKKPDPVPIKRVPSEEYDFGVQDEIPTPVMKIAPKKQLKNEASTKRRFAGDYEEDDVKTMDSKFKKTAMKLHEEEHLSATPSRRQRRPTVDDDFEPEPLTLKKIYNDKALPEDDDFDFENETIPKNPKTKKKNVDLSKVPEDPGSATVEELRRYLKQSHPAVFRTLCQGRRKPLKSELIEVICSLSKAKATRDMNGRVTPDQGSEIDAAKDHPSIVRNVNPTIQRKKVATKRFSEPSIARMLESDDDDESIVPAIAKPAGVSANTTLAEQRIALKSPASSTASVLPSTSPRMNQDSQIAAAMDIVDVPSVTPVRLPVIRPQPSAPILKQRKRIPNAADLFPSLQSVLDPDSSKPTSDIVGSKKQSDADDANFGEARRNLLAAFGPSLAFGDEDDEAFDAEAEDLNDEVAQECDRSLRAIRRIVAKCQGRHARCNKLIERRVRSLLSDAAADVLAINEIRGGFAASYDAYAKLVRDVEDRQIKVQEGITARNAQIEGIRAELELVCKGFSRHGKEAREQVKTAATALRNKSQGHQSEIQKLVDKHRKDAKEWRSSVHAL